MGRRIAALAAAVACAATLGAGLPGPAGSWVIQPTPNVPNAADNELVSVSCPAVADCIAVGTNNSNPSLTGLSCTAGGCTAVGNTILPGDAGTLTTLAEHG